MLAVMLTALLVIGWAFLCWLGTDPNFGWADAGDFRPPELEPDPELDYLGGDNA